MTKETYEKVVENMLEAQSLLQKTQEELLPDVMDGDDQAFEIYKEIRWRWRSFKITLDCIASKKLLKK